MHVPRLRFGLALLLLFVAAACHTQSSRLWHITLQLSPAQPGALDTVTFEVRVADRSQQPVDGAQVSVSLTMATMDMGTTTIPLHADGNGNYSGAGTFGMAGPWNAMVTVTDNGRTETMTQRCQVASHP